MPGLLARLRRPLPSLLSFAAALSLTLMVGCGDDNKNPVNPGGGATSSSFTGWFGNGTESGLLSVTVSRGYLAGQLRAPGAAKVIVNATGLLRISGGDTDTLNGTFEDDPGYIDLTGTNYTLTGVYDSGPPSVVSGTYTRPNGDGQFECQVGGASSADVYCGTYQNEAHTTNGSFIFAIRGSQLKGAAIEDGSGDATGFTGTVSGTGTTRTLAVTSTITNGYKLTATGQLDTGTHQVGGLYRIDNYSVPSSPAPYDSGGWTGELCIP